MLALAAWWMLSRETDSPGVMAVATAVQPKSDRGPARGPEALRDAPEGVVPGPRDAWRERWFPGARVARRTPGADGGEVELLRGGSLPANTVRVTWAADGEGAKPRSVTAGSHGLVQLADGADPEAWMSRMESLGFAVEPRAVAPGLYRVAWTPDPERDDHEARIAALGTDPAVRFAEPDLVGFAETIPLDWYGREFERERAFERGNRVVDAWSAGVDASSVVVGILDSGIGSEFGGFSDNIWVNPGETPENGIDDDGNGFVDDVHGVIATNDRQATLAGSHGRVVATFVGSGPDDLTTEVGVAWKVKLMGLKVLNENGTGLSSQFVVGLDYGVARGVKLFNASLGFDAVSTVVADAIGRLQAAGGLIVCSAGNSGANTDVVPHYPSSHPSAAVIAVGAGVDTRESYSNFGQATVDLFAPGSSRVSLVASDGTSYAAPQVTGAIALLKALRPAATAGQLKARVLDSVRPAPGLAGLCVTGGMLDIASAMAPWLPPPPGDTRAAPLLVAGSRMVASPVTLGATREAGEPGSGRAHTTWVRWTPEGPGPYTASAVEHGQVGGSPEILVFAVGSQTPLGTQIAGAPVATTTWDLPEGTPVDIQVADHGIEAGEVLLALAGATDSSRESAEVLEGLRPQGIHASGSGEMSGRWWRWRPSAASSATLRANISGLPTAGTRSLKVIEVGPHGERIIDRLDESTGSDASSWISPEFLRLDPEAEYFIHASGPGVIRWKLETRPYNDHRVSAVELSLGFGLFDAEDVYLTAATPEPFEPSHVGRAPVRSAWYRVSPNTRGRVQITASGPSGSAPRLAAYAARSRLTFAEARRISDQSLEIEFTDASPQIHLAIDSDSPGLHQVVIAVAATHDSIASARQLPSSGGDFGTLGFATAESGEPSHEGAAPSASVWFRHVADADRGALLVVQGSAMRPRIAIYREVGGLPGEELTLERGWSGTLRWARYHVRAGDAVLVAVDNADGFSGGGFRYWAHPVEHGPEAARAADRRELAQVLGSRDEADLGLARPAPASLAWPAAGARVTWWRTGSEVDGERRVRVRADSAGEVGVFTGASTMPLVSASRPAGGSVEVSWMGTAGTEYTLGVEGSGGRAEIEDLRSPRGPARVEWLTSSARISAGTPWDVGLHLRRVGSLADPLEAAIHLDGVPNGSPVAWAAGQGDARLVRVAMSISGGTRLVTATTGEGDAAAVATLVSGETASFRRLSGPAGITVAGRASTATGTALKTLSGGGAYSIDLATGRRRFLPTSTTTGRLGLESGEPLHGQHLVLGEDRGLGVLHALDGSEWVARPFELPARPSQDPWWFGPGRVGYTRVPSLTGTSLFLRVVPSAPSIEVSGWPDATTVVGMAPLAHGRQLLVGRRFETRSYLVRVDPDGTSTVIGDSVPGLPWTHVAAIADGGAWASSRSHDQVRLTRIGADGQILGDQVLSMPTLVGNILVVSPSGRRILLTGGATSPTREIEPAPGLPPAWVSWVTEIPLAVTDEGARIRVDSSGSEWEDRPYALGRAAVLSRPAEVMLREGGEASPLRVTVPSGIVPEAGAELGFRFTWPGGTAMSTTRVPHGATVVEVPLPTGGLRDTRSDGTSTVTVSFAFVESPIDGGDPISVTMLDDDTVLGRYLAERGVTLDSVDRDDDGDGWNGFQEWLQRGHPLQADAKPVPVSFSRTFGGGDWILGFDLPTALPGANLQFETSSDLRTWEPAAAVLAFSGPGSASDRTKRSYRFTGSQHFPKMAVRMKVTVPTTW